MEDATQLRQRLREIDCLYRLSDLENTLRGPLDETLDDAVALIPPALEHPEFAVVRLTVNGVAHTSKGFQSTKNRHTVPIFSNETEVGLLETCYVNANPGLEIGFLDHEQDFLKATGERLGQMVERFEARHKIVESEQFFRSFVELVGEGLSKTDSDERFVFSNPAADRIFGVPPGTLVGRTVTDFLDAEGLRILTEQTNLRKSGEATVYELDITRDNGTRLQLLVTAAPSPSKNGKYEGTIGIYRDITEYRRVLTDLADSEERFRRTFEEAPIGAAMIGMDRRFIRTNSRFREILGYSEDELMQMTFNDVTHPQDRAESDRMAESLIAGDVERVLLEKRYIRKGGDVVWGRLSALIMRHASGIPLYYLSMLEDATDYQQALDALRSSRERYAQAQRAGNIGSCDWNLQSDELFWSDNIDSIFGFEPGEFGRTYEAFVQCVHPEDRAGLQDTIRQAIRHGSEFRAEHRIVQPDGTVRWVLEVGNIDRDEGGRAAHIFGIIQDIDERRQAVITLRRSEQYYRAFFESAHDPVILFSAVDETVIDVNQRACEVYGFDRSEFVGLSLKSISRDVESGEKQVNLLLKQGSMDNFESVQFHKDGSPLHLEISASLLDYQGKPAILSINRDISDRKRVERELLKAKESAEASSLAKSQFLAHMSHEIRTPLNAIIGMTDLTLESALDQPQREFLTATRYSAEHLLAVVNDILDLSKIEAGKIELDLQDFVLHTLLEGLFAAMKPRAAEANLTLGFRLLPGVPDTFCGDTGRLRQVLYNLISNAIKFTTHGSIEVVVALVDAVDGNATLRFAVSDTGIGIREEKLEAIFDPFSQADGSTTRLYGGTGLGLAISRHLVELMGGELWVDSTEGVGSTFRFTAQFGPAKSAAAIIEPADEPAVPPPSIPLRVLLAEDFPASQMVAVAFLEKRGYEVVVAANGQRAVDDFQGQAFDLILMDVEMPIMDGIEATRRIRELEASGKERIPILALTAHAMKGIEERLVGLGMDAVLTKPVRKANLYEAIDRLMGFVGSGPKTLK